MTSMIQFMHNYTFVVISQLKPYLHNCSIYNVLMAFSSSTLVIFLKYSYSMLSGAFDVKTQSRRTVQKIQITFEDHIYSNRRFKMKFFPWMRTGQLKKILLKQKYNDKHKHLNQHDIRLFYKNIQLLHQNKACFQHYKLQDGCTVIITKNANSDHLQRGVINPYQIFQKTPQDITNLVMNVQSGLNNGHKPKLASEGTSGTYFLENNQKKIVAVYKPYDQQPYTPNNPRGYVAELGSQGIRRGILSGQCATRQVAAYLLDNTHFHQVPATTYVQFFHPCFSYKEVVQPNPILSNKQTDLKLNKTKHGSLQQFVQYMDVVGNLGAKQFDVNQVHKIAILDLRLLNCDRNQCNILVVKKLLGSKKITSLIPIDHGLSFPDNLEIYQHQIVWMGYSQASMPLSPTSLQFINKIDPVQDCRTLRQKLGFRQICLRNFRIAQIFLKKCAAAGFTLYQIGKFAYRGDQSDWSSSQDQQKQSKEQSKKETLSDLQKLVQEAQTIYFTVRDNGIKSTVQMQLNIIKKRNQQQEQQTIKVQNIISSQQQKLQLGQLIRLTSKKQLKQSKQTSIQKKTSLSPKKYKIRNISLPNLKKKPSQLRDRRLRLKWNRGVQGKNTKKFIKHGKGMEWDDIFFYYFEEILGRWIKRKMEEKKTMRVQPGARNRLFSQELNI